MFNDRPNYLFGGSLNTEITNIPVAHKTAARQRMAFKENFLSIGQPFQGTIEGGFMKTYAIAIVVIAMFAAAFTGSVFAQKTESLLHGQMIMRGEGGLRPNVPEDLKG